MSPGKARPAGWTDGAVGKLLAVSPADPSKGVPESATVHVSNAFGAVKVSVPLEDLVKDGTVTPMKVNRPGDRLAFGICRPFNGRDVELAAFINGKELQRFQYVPQRNDSDTLSPPARLSAQYRGASGSLGAESKKTLSMHLSLAAEGKCLSENELTSATCDSAAAELDCAVTSGQLSSRLRSLWTWRNVFDKYAELECGEILQDGLVLMVIDCMRLGLSSEFECGLERQGSQWSGKTRCMLTLTCIELSSVEAAGGGRRQTSRASARSGHPRNVQTIQNGKGIRRILIHDGRRGRLDPR